MKNLKISGVQLKKNNMLDSIIVLAGGESTRFWPLSDKNLLMFRGIPHIASQINLLKQFSNNIIIVVNDKNRNSIDSALKNTGIQYSIVVQKQNGQASAISAASEYVSGKSLVVNANDIFSKNVITTIEEKLQTNVDCVIATKNVTDYFPGGYVVEKDGYVSEIIEKPDENNVPSNRVKLVVDCFLDIQDFLATLASTTSKHDDVYEKALVSYIQKGKKIASINVDDDWVTLKYPWHVLDVKDQIFKTLKSSQGNNVVIAQNAVIKGEVYLDDNVVVHEFVTIIGPAYIGKNTIVGTYSMIRDSMIGNDCLIGSYSEVTRSYLGNNVFLHRNYVGDSVFDSNVLMGGDALVANFRFDEKEILSPINGNMVNSHLKKLGALVGSHVKIGVNSTIMPGVKIAPNSFVPPQSVIQKDFTQ